MFLILFYFLVQLFPEFLHLFMNLASEAFFVIDIYILYLRYLPKK